LFQLLDLHLA